MATKITRAVLESYLHCKVKGYLKLAGQQGTPCAFEAMRTQLRSEVRLKAIDTILARHPGDQVARNIPLALDSLKQGPQYILDGTLEDDALALHFDGLKRMEGQSTLGAFHYLPMLFHEGRQVEQEQKLLLEVYGLILSRIQGRVAGYGVVWHGRECRATRIRLHPDHRKAQQVLQDLKAMAGAESPPGLFLNDHCQVCEFRERCHQQAVQEDNLSLLLGMGEKEIRAYNRKGYFTVTQISHTFRYRKPRKRAKAHEHPHYYSLQARSIRTGIVHIHGSPSFPKAEAKVYLDMEGIPDRDLYYLIGAVVEVGESVTHHWFWADEEANQENMFLRFAELVRSLPKNCIVLHYGNYEATALKKMQGRIQPEHRELIQAVIDKLVNVLAVVHRHVYFPTYSNSLKDIGRFLGHQWTDAGASGIQSMYWRETWERTRAVAVQECLVIYNKEDCMALKKLCEFIRDSETARLEVATQGTGTPSVIQTSSLLKPRPKWPTYGRATFALGDLERASQCAYFDYQRERVYVRTNKRFKQINKRCKRPRLPFSSNKRVVIECKTCPGCGGNNIKRKHPLRQKTVDLKFFRGGVKKWIVAYRSWRYKCEVCGAMFRPDEWPKDHSLYQSGLACWCVYQNIECKQNMYQVRETLIDVFGLDVPPRQLYLFKDWIADRYRTLYEEIKRAIVQGHLVHVDETAVNLRNNAKGHVWVLASLDKVYFFYKPTREGTFLNEMLGGFRGVLVSDFFSAYESVDCPQQKCLLHFLRDINDDLQKNPFDEEFKRFAQDFATLLRRIVDTIDKHGLATSFLDKHVPAAHRFVEEVSTGTYSSEVMLGYQKRIKKSASRLFTFLEHDNVPWNNNNAEHAIKEFAKLRDLADGTFSERSLKEALLLLSVFQTCQFNGVNVLGFLLSGKNDLVSLLGM
jgi:predicted RecB family nuclease